MFVQRILPAILVVIPAAVVATVRDGRSEPAVDQCRTRPGLATAQGMNWYYRLDHVTRRQCWYLGSASAGRHANANAPELSAVAPTVPVPPQKPAAVGTPQAPQWQAADMTPQEFIFGKLLGIYVTLFFVVAQIVNLIFFGARPDLPIFVGGALIVTGGLVITFWRAS